MVTFSVLPTIEFVSNELHISKFIQLQLTETVMVYEVQYPVDEITLTLCAFTHALSHLSQNTGGGPHAKVGRPLEAHRYLVRSLAIAVVKTDVTLVNDISL